MEDDAIKKNEKGEIIVLGHSAWPGYKLAFKVTFSLFCIYLGVILYFSFQHMPAGGH